MDLRRTQAIWRRRTRHIHPAIRVAAVGAATVLVLTAVISHRLSPLVRDIALDEVRNTVNLLLNETAAELLAQYQLGYEDLVRLERDDSGLVTSASTDLAAVNSLNQELVIRLTEKLNGVDLHQLDIPLGSLLGLDLLSGRGPSLEVQALWVGTVETQVENEFTEAGINQTLHRVMLTVGVPTTILLAGSRLECRVDTQVCLAESIIVGTVPGTYIRLAGQ